MTYLKEPWVKKSKRLMLTSWDPQHLRNHINLFTRCSTPGLPGCGRKDQMGLPALRLPGWYDVQYGGFQTALRIQLLKAPIMKDKSLLDTAQSESAMGHLGKIRSEKDLPSIKKLGEAGSGDAMTLNEMGMKVPARTPMAGKKNWTCLITLSQHW